MTKNPRQSDGFPLAVVVEGVIALAAVLLAWIAGVPLREQMPQLGAPLGWALLRGLIATVPLLVMFWWIIHSSWPTLIELQQQVERLIGEMFPSASIGQLALVATLAGVGEELLFRGVLQTIFGWWTTPAIGVVITSLVFGLMHALSKPYFFLATAIGLCFGWMTWYYHDLVAPMVAHTLYDFVALVYLSRLRASGKMAPPPESP
jgi:membrane protease YdiL (CAAX protease family)